MELSALVSRVPFVYHVAEANARASIEEYGLLSTSALLDLHGITGERRATIEARPRPRSVVLDTPGLPQAVIRDQRPLLPLRDEHLVGGLTVSDWCRLLNARVYLFTTEADAAKLAAAYPVQQVDVLRTAALLECCAADIELARINTGNAMRRPAPRGPSTFARIEGFSGSRIAEFTVRWAIPNFAGLVVRR